MAAFDLFFAALLCCLLLKPPQDLLVRNYQVAAAAAAHTQNCNYALAQFLADLSQPTPFSCPSAQRTVSLFKQTRVMFVYILLLLAALLKRAGLPHPLLCFAWLVAYLHVEITVSFIAFNPVLQVVVGDFSKTLIIGCMCAYTKRAFFLWKNSIILFTTKLCRYTLFMVNLLVHNRLLGPSKNQFYAYQKCVAPKSHEKKKWKPQPMSRAYRILINQRLNLHTGQNSNQICGNK